MGKTKDIRAALEDELIFDPLVDSSDIRVETLRYSPPGTPPLLTARAHASRVELRRAAA